MIELNARQKLLLSQVNCGGRGLEIGPSYSPVLPKATGLNIQIADYLSETELKIKYAHAPGVDIQKIEKVDYILGDRTLGEALDENGKFDFIIASHVVEHLPDLLGFLQDCQKLLTPEGVLVLAVPDKRACFDFLVPLSSTGQVIDANAAHTRRVSVGNIFDSEINRVTLDGQWAWPLGSPGCLLANGSIAHTQRLMITARDKYLDVHRWFFVPSSFRLILQDLRELGLLELNERAFLSTTHIEFYCFLSKAAPRGSEDRVSLALAALREQADALSSVELKA